MGLYPDSWGTGESWPHAGPEHGEEKSADWQRRVAMEASIEARQSYPDTTFTDEWRTSVGDETVVARYHGAGHTNGDIVVTLEQANVVHLGDLIFNRFHPIIDRCRVGGAGGGSGGVFIRTIVLAMSPSRVGFTSEFCPPSVLVVHLNPTGLE